MPSILIEDTADKTTLGKKAATVSRIALCQAAVSKVPARKSKVSKKVHAAAADLSSVHAATGVNKGKVSTTAVTSSNVPDIYFIEFIQSSRDDRHLSHGETANSVDYTTIQYYIITLLHSILISSFENRSVEPNQSIVCVQVVMVS